MKLYSKVIYGLLLLLTCYYGMWMLDIQINKKENQPEVILSDKIKELESRVQFLETKSIIVPDLYTK